VNDTKSDLGILLPGWRGVGLFGERE